MVYVSLMMDLSCLCPTICVLEMDTGRKYSVLKSTLGLRFCFYCNCDSNPDP